MTTMDALPQCIGVVGAGQMGRGIAQVLAQSGRVQRVLLQDVSPQALHMARSLLHDNLLRLAAKNALAGQSPESILARMAFESDVQALAPCAWVIEAIPEDEALKRALFQRLDTLLPPAAVLASNTSSLPISGLASATRRPGQVIGLHFMNPPPRMALVEVIPGEQTSPAVRDQALALVRALGKTPVISRDVPGFLANRLLMPLLNEAMHALAQGVGSAEDIDATCRLGLNHPMGPLALADHIGLDTCLAILTVLHQGLGEARFAPCALLRDHVTAGRLGRKTGRGFYEYPETLS